MTRCVIVIPSIHPPTTMGCLATIHPDLIDPAVMPGPPTRQRSTWVATVNGKQWTDGQPDLRLVVVWNTPEHNEGCSKAWNTGRDEALRTGADWLVVLSAAVRFGPDGGLRDFFDQLERQTGQLVVEAGGGLGWHLIGFSREVMETVGPWDEIFTPCYFEDNEWSVRFQRIYDCDTHAPGWVGPLWPKVPVDAHLLEIAHGIKRGGVEIDMAGLRAKFHAKWGPNEEYRFPYDDPSLPLTFTGPPA